MPFSNLKLCDITSYARGVDVNSPNIHTRERAAEIASEGKALEAERVVFFASGKHHFSNLLPAEILATLEGWHPASYKFQVRRERRWIDATKYWSVNSEVDVLAALRNVDADRFRFLPAGSAARAAESSPQEFSGSLRILHRKVFDELSGKASHNLLSRARTILETLDILQALPEVRYLSVLFELYDVLLPFGVLKGIKAESIESASAAIKSQVAAGGSRFIGTEAEIAIENVLGKIYSLVDRDTSAAHFRKLRETDTEGLTERFYLDLGAWTYFSETEVEAVPAEDVLEIKTSISEIDPMDPHNDLGILVALDPKFYRIYAPALYFYAQQLPDIDFNLLLCGESIEVEAALAEGRYFRDALAQLNRSGRPSNVHHLRIPVPRFAKDPVTFYATARFFASDWMLDRYENAYLMDADLSTDTDPRPYFNRIASLPFAVPKIGGFAGFMPWRRHMAGNVALNRAVLASSLLVDIQKYATIGLKSHNSWTLDQNALSYSIEKHPKLFSDLSKQARPFYQQKFRSVWEKNCSA